MFLSLIIGKVHQEVLLHKYEEQDHVCTASNHFSGAHAELPMQLIVARLQNCRFLHRTVNMYIAFKMRM